MPTTSFFETRKRIISIIPCTNPIENTSYNSPENTFLTPLLEQNIYKIPDSLISSAFFPKTQKASLTIIGQSRDVFSSERPP